MANLQVKEAMYGVDELPCVPGRLSSGTEGDEPACMEATGEPEAVTDSEAAETGQDLWNVGTACYMCHACTNFGVHGKEVRPCANGLSNLIKRRHKARMSTKTGRGV